MWMTKKRAHRLPVSPFLGTTKTTIRPDPRQHCLLEGGSRFVQAPWPKLSAPLSAIPGRCGNIGFLSVNRMCPGGMLRTPKAFLWVDIESNWSAGRNRANARNLKPKTKRGRTAYSLDPDVMYETLWPRSYPVASRAPPALSYNSSRSQQTTPTFLAKISSL